MAKEYYPQEPIKGTCLRVILYVECLLLCFFYLHMTLLSFENGVLIFFKFAYFIFLK